MGIRRRPPPPACASQRVGVNRLTAWKRLPTPTPALSVDFVHGLKAHAARVETAAPNRLARRMLLAYGTAELFEWTHSHTVGKVVFDVDGKASETTAAALLAAALAGVEAFLGFRPSRIVIAASHGADLPPDHPSAGKLSYRVFVLGFRMAMKDIKARLVRLGLDNRHGGPFDAAIYSVNQKLRMVGSIKTPTDRRNLALVTPDGQPIAPTAEALLDTIVQVVDPTWTLLEDSAPSNPFKRTKLQGAEAPTRAAPQPAPQPDPQPAQTADQASESEDEETTQPFTPPDPQDAVRLLHAAGFVDVQPLKKQSRKGSLRFNAARDRPCACCGNRHDSNGFWCGLLHDGRLIVKNYSDRCRSMVLGESRFIVSQDRATVIRQQVDEILGAAGDQLAGLLSQHKLVLDHAMRAPMDLATLRHVSGERYSVVSNGSVFQFENVLAECFRIVPQRGLPFLTVSPLEIKVLKALIASPTEDIGHARWLEQAELQAGVRWKADLDDNLFRSRGGLWEPVKPNDLAAAFQIMATTKVEIILDTLERSENEDKELVKRVRKGAAALKRYVSQARSAGQVVIAARRVFLDRKLHETLDRDPHVLGTPDGVLDLRTGRILTGDDRPPVSQSVRPRWRGLDMPTPDVDAFFASLFPERETVAYVKRLLGASLSGCLLQVYLCFVGTGANGKSVTLEWLRHVLMDYHALGDAYIFFADNRHSNSATPALTALDKKRLVVVEESQPQDPLNTAVVKRLTGASAITARELYQNSREFPLTHTQVLATNELPKVDVDDEAMMRRIVVIPFEMRFKTGDEHDPANPTHRQADPEMAAFLRSDTPSEQLLVWLVQGCMDHYAAGCRLPPKPPAVRRVEAAYRSDNDPIGRVIEEECEIGEGLRVEAADFNARASAAGAKRGVASAMARRGYTRRTQRMDDGRVGVQCYIGLTWTANAVPPQWLQS